MKSMQGTPYHAEALEGMKMIHGVTGEGADW